MPLPIGINLRIARRQFAARLSGRGAHLPLVLMLELTHACNLNCQGCGRIREYAGTRALQLTRAQAEAALLAAETPVVTISGGEPLLHPDAPAIAARALEMGKVVYLCTNGLLLARRLKEFRPDPRFYFNVHLDGQAEVHDALAGLPGTAKKALAAIRLAKSAGFGVTTNTTIYRTTRPEEVAALFAELTHLGVDGLMVAPAFAYEIGAPAPTLTRSEAHQVFDRLREVWGDRNLYHTPIYMQFLRGERQLECLPWGTVTYNPHGWKRPCYLLTDDHVATFQELMEETDWEAYGPGADPRCADCMLHSGFEPSVMSRMRGPRDWLQMARWQLWG